jgi:hypothetical protein
VFCTVFQFLDAPAELEPDWPRRQVPETMSVDVDTVDIDTVDVDTVDIDTVDIDTVDIDTVDVDTVEYTTSASAFGTTTPSLSCLPKHVSQLEKNKMRLEQDETLRARYLPAKASEKESVEPLDAVLKPSVSTLERRKQRLADGDEMMMERYQKASAPRRRSALQRELEAAEALLNGQVLSVDAKAEERA